MRNKNLNAAEQLLPKAYRPLSPWNYFWRAVLYSIPVIGWIFMLTHAFAGKSRHGRAFAPLSETITDISAVTDLVALLKRMTHGAFDLTENLPSGDWLDEILFSWIHGHYFNDPAGNGMTPALSGGDVFRIGLAAGDDALTALGARIWHSSHVAPKTVTGRLLDLSACSLLEAEGGKPPLLRYAVTRRNMLMAARIPGLYCAMHVGGGRGNAGDFCLFADGEPILMDGGSAFNLPSINGRNQLPRPARPCIADFEDRESRELMSVDLSHAYPAECTVHSYQRTALTLREEHTVRIVDALHFEQPASITFRFVTPLKPTALNSVVRLGPVRMTWEGAYDVTVSQLDNGLSLIELSCPQPVIQTFFTFNFERT